MRSSLRELQIETNGVRLHVVEAGPADGPLVLLLHGFPEFWWGWHRQIDALADAGMRLWIPDQRGYNLSEKPTHLSAYRPEELVQDAADLIRASGAQRAHIVGHDWGAAVAWWLAAQQPNLVDRLAILNVPHPRVMLQTLRSNPNQLLRSWYIYSFQIPRLPELLLRMNGFALLAAMLRQTARPGTFSEEDFQSYRKAWAQPGALTGMLNWYRAAFGYGAREIFRSGSAQRIQVPTLIIWGVHDPALSRRMVQPSVDLCDQGEIAWFEDAGHWVQHEKADRVNRLILRHLLDHPPT